MTILTVTGSTTIDAGTVYDVVATSGTAGFRLVEIDVTTPDVSLVNYGSLTLTAAEDYVYPIYLIYTASVGLNTIIDNRGTMTATALHDRAFGIYGYYSAAIINSGHLSVSAATTAYGIECGQVQSVDGGFNVDNSGTITVNGGNTAYGVRLDYGGSMVNSGTVTVVASGGTGSVAGIYLGDGLYDSQFVNSGTISVTGNGTGNGLDNVITAGDGNNVLTGLGGNDTLNAGAGTDRLYGGSGNDVLQGGAGGDKMWGGAGDDIYYVDYRLDLVTELAGEGVDTVYASIDYVMTDNVERLVMVQTNLLKLLSGTGNALDNDIQGSGYKNTLDGGFGNDTLHGGGASDTLIGGSGDDWLDGGGSNDVMAGGAGDDTYVVDLFDVPWVQDTVTELAGEGIDTVMASVTYVLGDNVENLSLLEGGKYAGTGNALDNHILGNASVNTLTGLDGNDALDGGLGADTLVGGLGDDSYYVDNRGDVVTELASQGRDTVYSGVTYTLSANVELLVLTGLGNNSATGNALDNSLTGNSGDNVLDGKAGADTMTGGLGNDSYIVDNAGDVIVEAASEGSDSVTSSISFSLAGRFVENLTLSGSGNTAGIGNTFNNVLTGNAGSNSLDGGVGNDILDGKAGADTMTGGFGDDVFYVDNIADSVVEIAGQGNDAILASVTYSLTGRFVETLTLTGSGAVDATGNSQANVLNGNAGNNHLDGGYGHDVLTGGLGADVFVFGTHSGADTITDFSAADNDTINVHAYLAQATAVISQSGADAVIDLGGGNVITVLNTTATDAAFLSHIVW